MSVPNATPSISFDYRRDLVEALEGIQWMLKPNTCTPGMQDLAFEKACWALSRHYGELADRRDGNAKLGVIAALQPCLALGFFADDMAKLMALACMRGSGGDPAALLQRVIEDKDLLANALSRCSTPADRRAVDRAMDEARYRWEAWEAQKRPGQEAEQEDDGASCLPSP